MPRPPGQGNGDGWNWNGNQNWNPDNPFQRPGNWTDPSGNKWQWDPDPNNHHGGPHWDIDDPSDHRTRVDPHGNPLPEEKYEYETRRVCPLPAVNPETVTKTVTIGGVVIIIIRIISYLLPALA